MAKKEKTVNAATDQLAALTIGESTTIGGMTYARVPGGYVVILGSTSCFVPLSQIACGELGIEFVDEDNEQ